MICIQFQTWVNEMKAVVNTFRPEPQFLNLLQKTFPGPCPLTTSAFLIPKVGTQVHIRTERP